MSLRRGTLYLLPALLATTDAERVLPAATIEVARRLDYLLVENARSARALLKAIGHSRPIAQIQVVEIGHDPDAALIDGWLAPLLHEGRDAAIVSEAGCPGVADPGATLVARAHALGLAVRPLVGPSAILLAVMASGLNGQQFRFVGYLPREATALAQRLRELEQASRRGETQVFIETPYRNERLLAAILAACSPTTRLSVALELTGPQESISTRTVAQWRQLVDREAPKLDRRPAVFSLLAEGPSSSAHARGRAKASGRQ